jgi:hypothetical protein
LTYISYTYIIPAMKRTSVLLPPDLRNRADRRARQLGISFGELVRRALVRMLESAGTADGGDAFLADGAVHRGDAPDGASIHHDDHLYGERR